MSSVSIIGSGAWGTAIASAAERAGSETLIWSKDKSTVDGIQLKHLNPECFTGQKLAASIRATSDLREACEADILVVAVPAQIVRFIAHEMKKVIAPGKHILIASKGIEQDTGLLMSEILAEILPDQFVGILSGPSFAEEVFQGKPTALTMAVPDINANGWMAKSFHSPSLRIYLTDDVIGAQMGGALKNVLAIACGLVSGRNLGENMLAMLVTRGLAEITRLALAKGARAETLCGMSGLGDICLTCTSPTSRNFQFGYEIGQGRALEDIFQYSSYLVEGYFTSKVIAKLAKNLNVDMPVCFAIDAVLNHGVPVDEVIRNLMSRPIKIESFAQPGKEAS